MKVIIENEIDRREIRIKKFKLGVEIIELFRLYGIDITSIKNYNEFFCDLGFMCGQFKDYQEALKVFEK